MLYVNPETYDHRLGKCRKCEHYNLNTRTCGRLILGDTVKVDGEDVKLCGCVMPVKAKLKIADCPLKKWSPQITDEDRVFWQDLLVRLDGDPRKTLSESDRQHMITIYETAFDTSWSPTNCSKCWMNLTKALKQWFIESEHQENLMSDKRPRRSGAE